jgi:hypothetical protein
MQLLLGMMRCIHVQSLLRNLSLTCQPQLLLLLLLLPSLIIACRQHQPIQAGRQPLLQHHSQCTARCRSWPANASGIVCNSTANKLLISFYLFIYL